MADRAIDKFADRTAEVLRRLDVWSADQRGREEWQDFDRATYRYNAETLEVAAEVIRAAALGHTDCVPREDYDRAYTDAAIGASADVDLWADRAERAEAELAKHTDCVAALREARAERNQLREQRDLWADDCKRAWAERDRVAAIAAVDREERDQLETEAGVSGRLRRDDTGRGPTVTDLTEGDLRHIEETGGLAEDVPGLVAALRETRAERDRLREKLDATELRLIAAENPGIDIERVRADRLARAALQEGVTDGT